MIACICSQESQLHKATRIKVSLLADHDWDLKIILEVMQYLLVLEFAVVAHPSKCSIECLVLWWGMKNRQGLLSRGKEYENFNTIDSMLNLNGWHIRADEVYLLQTISFITLWHSNLHFATQDFRWFEFRVLMNKKTAPLEGLRSTISNQFQPRWLIVGNWKHN